MTNKNIMPNEGKYKIPQKEIAKTIWNKIGRIFFGVAFFVQGQIIFFPATVEPYIFIANIMVFISVVMVGISMWNVVAKR